MYTDKMNIFTLRFDTVTHTELYFLTTFRYASILDPSRRTYAGMLSALDEGLGNLTATLQATGLYVEQKREEGRSLHCVYAVLCAVLCCTVCVADVF